MLNRKLFVAMFGIISIFAMFFIRMIIYAKRK